MNNVRTVERAVATNLNCFVFAYDFLQFILWLIVVSTFPHARQTAVPPNLECFYVI